MTETSQNFSGRKCLRLTSWGKKENSKNPLDSPFPALVLGIWTGLLPSLPLFLTKDFIGKDVSPLYLALLECPELVRAFPKQTDTWVVLWEHSIHGAPMNYSVHGKNEAGTSENIQVSRSALRQISKWHHHSNDQWRPTEHQPREVPLCGRKVFCCARCLSPAVYALQ